MFTKTKKLSLFIVLSSVLGACSQLPTNVPVYNLNNTQNNGLKPALAVQNPNNVATNTTTANNNSFASPSFVIPTAQNNVDNTVQNTYNNSQTAYNNTQVNNTYSSTTPNSNTTFVAPQVNTQVNAPLSANNSANSYINSCRPIPAYTVHIPKFPNGKPDYSQIQKNSYHATNYVVQKGDTLYLISYLTGRSVSDLAVLNKINTNVGLNPGQTIIVNPVKCNAPVTSSTANGSTYVPNSRVTSNINTGSVSNAVNNAVNQVTNKSNLVNNTTAKINSTVNNTVAKVNKVVDVPKVTKVASNVTSAVTTTTNKINTTSTNFVTNTANNVNNKVNNLTNVASNVVSGPNGQNTSSNALYWPAKGRVLNDFTSSSKGIEIAGNNGDPIHAAASGTVSYAGQFQGYGNIILIKNSNDMITLYAHNSKLLVQTGQKVKRGQTIALMGSTGTTKTELYFEVRIHGKTVNPLKYLPPR